MFYSTLRNLAAAFLPVSVALAYPIGSGVERGVGEGVLPRAAQVLRPSPPLLPAAVAGMKINPGRRSRSSATRSALRTTRAMRSTTRTA